MATGSDIGISFSIIKTGRTNTKKKKTSDEVLRIRSLNEETKDWKWADFSVDMGNYIS